MILAYLFDNFFYFYDLDYNDMFMCSCCVDIDKFLIKMGRGGKKVEYYNKTTWNGLSSKYKLLISNMNINTNPKYLFTIRYRDRNMVLNTGEEHSDYIDVCMGEWKLDNMSKTYKFSTNYTIELPKLAYYYIVWNLLCGNILVIRNMFRVSPNEEITINL